MIEQDELRQLQDALSRWRDGCIRYFKLDLAIIAAIAAVVSYLKLKNPAILTVAHDYRVLINLVVALLVYSLAFELFLTNFSNSVGLGNIATNARARKITSTVCSVAYLIQAFAHIGLFAYTAGFLSGYSDSFVAHFKGG